MTVEIAVCLSTDAQTDPSQPYGCYLSWFELDDPWMCYQLGCRISQSLFDFLPGKRFFDTKLIMARISNHLFGKVQTPILEKQSLVVEV